MCVGVCVVSDFHGCCERVTQTLEVFLGCAALQYQGYRKKGFRGGTTLQNVCELSSRAQVIQWPEIHAAAAQRALNRQAWWDAVKDTDPSAFRSPNGVDV
eukprot:363312-Chlamydomonas_euryale.AAC.2